MENRERYFYGKNDKLKSRKNIEQLFKSGKSFSNYPFKVMWLPADNSALLQAGVAVSSRYFKKATDRNRIKRLMREAYRLQKNPLQQLVHSSQSASLSVFIIYIGKELPSYELIFEKMGVVINRLIKMWNEKSQVLS